MKNLNIVIFSFIISLFFSNIFSQNAYLLKAKRLSSKFGTDAKYDSFKEFYSFREELNEEQKLNIDIDEEIYDSILRYTESIFKKSHSDSLFKTCFLLNQIFKNNAEDGEIVATLYSNYFVKNIHKCLDILNTIKDKEMLEELISESVFVEGNDLKIIKFIKEKNLINQPFFEYYKQYER